MSEAFFFRIFVVAFIVITLIGMTRLVGAIFSKRIRNSITVQPGSIAFWFLMLVICAGALIPQGGGLQRHYSKPLAATLSTRGEVPYNRFFSPPADLLCTQLDLRITPLKTVISPFPMEHMNGYPDTLGFPVRIENRSRKTITATINHEWGGGIAPRSDLAAAVKAVDAPPQAWSASEVLLAGEDGSTSEPVVWQPGQSHDFLLRLDYRGTGSEFERPLISAPGRYVVKISLLFKAGGNVEYFESPKMNVVVVEKETKMRRWAGP